MKAWRVKSKIVSKFLDFSVSRGYMCLCMLLASGVLALFPKSIQTGAEAWFGITILFIVLPHIVFRGIFKYREIPDGWLDGTYKAWRERHEGIGFQNVKGNGLNINWKKTGYVVGVLVAYVGGLNGILILIVACSGEYMTYDIIAFVISAIIAPYLYLKIFRPNRLENNASVRFKNMQRAGVVKSKVRFRKISTGGGMKYSSPKSVGSGYFQSNFGHWDANRFDPVGDQRRLRGEGI